jgi:hypothetical protein
MGGAILSAPLRLYGLHVDNFMYFINSTKNPYTAVRPMGIRMVKE